jgi:DNA repair exonuclease SbcCD ATPase subunit
VQGWQHAALVVAADFFRSESAMTEATPKPQDPVDLQGELNDLKGKVQTDQDKITDFTKEIAGWQQDISVLQTGISDIEQTVKAYTQAVQSAGDLDALQSFIHRENDMAVAAVGAGKRVVDEIVKDYDTDLEHQTKNVGDLQKYHDQAASDYAQAQKTAADKQAAYDQLKSLVARFQAWVADVKNLKTQVLAAADTGNYGAMYFLVGEMKSVAAKLEAAPSADDFRNQLTNALSDLQQAKKDMRNKKAKLDDLTAQLAAAQKALSSAQAGRRAALLDAIKKQVPPEPPPKQAKSERNG